MVYNKINVLQAVGKSVQLRTKHISTKNVSQYIAKKFASNNYCFPAYSTVLAKINLPLCNEKYKQ